MPANKTKSERMETAVQAAPRVLLYDTENSANIIAAWGVHEQDALEVLEHRQIITVSWKWLGEKGLPKVLSLPDFPLYKRDPKNNLQLVKHLHSLMEQADIVLGHNAAEFDCKRVNTEIIKHNLPPPPPHKVIDTLKAARKHFGFNFNSLKALAEFLGLPHKLETGGYRLWKGCREGDMASWAKMSKYCAGDTRTLEALYLRFRPWMTNHPNMTAFDGLDGCPACRSRRLQHRGWMISVNTKRMRFQCQDCGKWSTGDTNKGSWRFR